MPIADQVSYVSRHILTLPYDDRLGARDLVIYWKLNKRMSQLQQLRLERYVKDIERRERK